MEENLQNTSGKLTACQAQLVTVTVAKQELENRLRDVEEQLRSQILAHEQDLKDSKSDIDYLTRQNKELRNTINSLQESIEEPDTQIEEKLKVLTAAYERNLNIIASQENYIIQVENQNITFADQIEKLQESNGKLEAKKKVLTDENNSLRAKNKEMIEALEKVTKEAEKIISEHVKREESRKNQQDEYMALVKKHTGLEKKFKDLCQNYEKLEKEMASKNERINSIRNSKSICEGKFKEEEKKNEDLSKRLKIFENSVKYQRKLDSSEITQIQLEQDLKLAESERKLKQLTDKIEPLIKRNSQLEKLIEKQNIHTAHLKNIQKDLSSTITFLNLELADYRKEGISLISPSPNIRKSQYLAFQNSSGIDKSYKMDPNRFSPLKFQEKEDSDMSPIREVPRPMRNQEVFFADTSEFIPPRILTPDETGEFVLNNS